MGKLRRWLWRRLMLLQHPTSHPRKRELHIYGDLSWPRVQGCPDNHHLQLYYNRCPDCKVSCKRCWPSIVINQRSHLLIADPLDADEYDDTVIRVDIHASGNCINDGDESDDAIKDGQPGIDSAAQYCCSSSSRGLIKLCLKPSKTLINARHNYGAVDQHNNGSANPDFNHDQILDKAQLCRSFSQGDGHHQWQRQYSKLGTHHRQYSKHNKPLLRRSHSCGKFRSIISGNYHSGSNGCKQHHDHSTVVMKGYVAVYVGEDEESLQRFLVPVSYLSHPAFRELLQRAEREFGFGQKAEPSLVACPSSIRLSEKSITMTIIIKMKSTVPSPIVSPLTMPSWAEASAIADYSIDFVPSRP